MIFTILQLNITNCKLYFSVICGRFLGYHIQPFKHTCSYKRFWMGIPKSLIVKIFAP